MQVSEIKYLAPLGKSDHNVLSFDFNCYLDYSKPKQSPDYNKGDYENMRNKVRDSQWLRDYSKITADTTVEEKWNSLKDMLGGLRKEFVPMRSISGNPTWKDKDRVPLTKEIRDSIKKKNKAHRDWMKGTSSQENRLLYVRERNRTKSLIRNAKKQFEKAIAMQSNPKAFWKHVRRKLKTKPGIAPLYENVEDKESIKFKDEEKANILQTQFSSVFTKEPAGSVPLLEKRTNSTIQKLYITVAMVEEELDNLSPYKSIGPGETHPRMLKELKSIISGPIALLFNLTMERGVLPTDWKLAFVSPIHKKGSKNIAENYRPISLTAVLCKLMEKFVRSTILQYLLDNKLLSRRQFGFINGRSTTTQLLYFLDKCVNNIAEGGVVDTIYLDFAKAFDTVAHRRLLGKLSSYGIGGQLHDWIREFITGRSQVVQVNGSSSTSADVLSGIPQGSVLGPLLFVIYINDITDNLKSDSLLYADDTKIFRRIMCKKDAEELQSDLNMLEAWSRKWLLSFHPDKCHVLTLGKFENIQHTERYRVYDMELDHVFEEKDIGVIVDSDLSFAEHISTKVRVANAMVGLIRRSFSYLNGKTFKKLYTAHVRPHLEYAQAAWAPMSRKLINMLENVQIRATKLVDGFGNLDYAERLRRLDLPTLVYRRQRGDMIEVYKHFTKYDRDTISSSFRPKDRTSRRLNHNFQLHDLKAKDGVRGVHYKSFYQRVPSMWNNLDTTVVNSENVNKFKNNLDDFWRDARAKYDPTQSD